MHWLWKKQLGAAVQLKKKYSEEAILSAIKSKDFDRLLVLGVQNGRGYKINPEAEKVIAKHQRLIDDQKVKTTVNLDQQVEEKKLETRSTQSYNTGKKPTISQLRNL